MKIIKIILFLFAFIFICFNCFSQDKTKCIYGYEYFIDAISSATIETQTENNQASDNNSKKVKANTQKETDTINTSESADSENTSSNLDSENTNTPKKTDTTNTSGSADSENITEKMSSPLAETETENTTQELSPEEILKAEALTEYEILKKAYPNINMTSSYDEVEKDWTITITNYGRTTVLYRAGGRYILKKYLPTKEDYVKLIYPFSTEVMDPKNFSKETINRIGDFSSSEKRKKAPVTTSDFFDAIYASTSQIRLEGHLKRITFFNVRLNIHELIAPIVLKVQEEIYKLAKTNSEVSAFINSKPEVSTYLWREIRDSKGRSFHSMALAIDFLPRKKNKPVYWLWEKNAGNKKWMLVPLEDRWMPLKAVIEIFEKYGFCWGGKWAIWDNMHFEYRPELIVARDYLKSEYKKEESPKNESSSEK